VDWIPTIFGVEIKEWATWTADLNTDIVSYYKLDNNLFTDSLGTNNGTNYGTTNTSGIINDGRSFDGTNDYIDLGVFADVKANDAKTVSMWVKGSAGSAAGYYGTVSDRPSSGAYGFALI